MPLLDSVEKGDRLYIVMPYLSGGDLFDSICGSALPSVSRCRTVFAQLVSAVDYMHSIGVRGCFIVLRWSVSDRDRCH